MDVIFVVAYQYGSILLAVAPVSHPVLPRKSLASREVSRQSPRPSTLELAHLTVNAGETVPCCSDRTT